MSKIRRKSSRRRFLTLSSASLAGLWAGCSDQLGARAVRGLIAETRRPILSPNFHPTPASWDSNAITAAWLGHSTVLVNFYGLTILTDPVLFKRIGADSSLGTLGPKRLVAPALRPQQLPYVDLVLLSHAHMDHLHPPSLRSLPGSPSFVTAYATSDLIPGKFQKTQELKWGQKFRIETRHGDVEVTAFEVKHWGARWRYDNYRGYNGYIVEREGRKLLFGGDTALTESFRRLPCAGPYDLAFMPIGAYQPWICSHCTPEQAVQMTNDAGANHFAPIHFKTFPFGRERTAEPLERLTAALEPERLAWRDIGQTFRLT